MPEYIPYRPATPALDFLAFVQGRAETPGYNDVLGTQDLATIGRIIAARDEHRARSQLIRMQARLTDRAFLEPDDLARLEAATGIGRTPLRTRPQKPDWVIARLWWFIVFLGLVLGLVLGVTLGVIVPWVHNNVHNNAGGTPPAGAAPQHPPAVQVAPGYTDLQLFKQDWGPWQQLTPSDAAPQTGAPALLLLESGGYYTSPWTVSPQARGWVQDIGGDVGTVNVHGDYIDFTDINGNPGIVRVDQPFVVSTNPLLVLRIDGTGTVYSMSQAQAIAMRFHLK